MQMDRETGDEGKVSQNLTPHPLLVQILRRPA